MSMNTARHVAIVSISYDLLIEALVLPPGTVITGVRNALHWNALELRVEHPDLKPVEPNGAIPRAEPLWRRQDVAVFVGWQQ
jgi:hypothetical protein